MNILAYKDKIWVQIKQLEENLHTLYKPLANRFSLSVMELRVLAELGKGVTLTMGELAKRMAITGTNLSPICKGLEKKGLLLRHRNQEDERIVEVQVSEEGVRILEQCEEMVQKRYEKLPKPNRQDFDNMVKSLENINDYVVQLNNSL